MKLSEMIAKIGDDNVAFQNLDACAISLNYSQKNGTKITFGTDEGFGLNGTNRLGLIIWIDRDRVKNILAKDLKPVRGK